MKYTEGAFRQWGYELAREEFPSETITESEWSQNPGEDPAAGKVMVKDRIADMMFQQVLLRPEEYSVIATPNLNGDYLSDALAAQVGGLGLAPGANMGDTCAVFEATHGSAPQYAGQDKVNPGSLIFSGALLLEHIGWTEAAESIYEGLQRTISRRIVTYDLARQMADAREVSCSGFGRALIENLALIGPWGSGVSSLVSPPRCPFCRSPAVKNQKPGLCPECRQGIRWITPPFCPGCGLPYPSGGPGHLCEDCLREPPYFDGARSLVVYQGPMVQAVQRLKYQKEFFLTGALGWILGLYSWEEESYDILIPVPLHRRRLRARGFNQAVLLIRACQKIPADKMKLRVLRRIRPTPPQVHLNRAERQKNVREAFRVPHPREIDQKKIMLLDDVYTTGATVNECARVLKQAGARQVSVLTLARVVPA